MTTGLTQAGLPQASSYFFIRTLQSQDRVAIRRALTQTEEIVSQVGVDLFRKYLVGATRLADYDAKNQSVYLYMLGKTTLLSGQYAKAIDYLNAVSSSSPFYAYSLQLRGTAKAVQGMNTSAIRDFQECVSRADRLIDQAKNLSDRYGDEGVKSSRLKADDLKARCRAGIARTHYQADQFREADDAYDKIPKASFVWTDILFEQAWNAFAQGEYNRALGRLVSYQSPSLKFVYNSEVDVLQAQSFLALCLYSDANQVINQFNAKYSKLGEEVKRFVESNADDLEAFYHAGKRALQGPLHTDNAFNKLMNRFVRGPYFQTSALSEKAIAREMVKAERFGAMQSGASTDAGHGFPGFIRRVLDWRAKTARYLGGAFVKNSIIDYHSVLISDFEKMAFIKLEMLQRAKEKLMDTPRTMARTRGNREPERKPYQYYWTFNGEFWVDELGDYVFGLESECDRT